MKVDLNFELFDLDGKLINKANKLISGLFMSEMKGDAEKLFDWAISFHKGDVVEMDSSDIEKIKTLLTTTERMAVMVKAPILKYLQSLK